MPPRAIKHQLTCPIELTSGSFLIGKRGILIIPRNCLVGPESQTTLLGKGCFRGHPLYFKLKDIVSLKARFKTGLHKNLHRITLAHFKLKKIKGSVNNPQLATNFGGCLIINFGSKRNLGGVNRIIFTSLTDNSVLIFSYFLEHGKGQTKCLLETTYPLMEAMLGVLSGRDSLFK